MDKPSLVLPGQPQVQTPTYTYALVSAAALTHEDLAEKLETLGGEGYAIAARTGTDLLIMCRISGVRTT